MSWCFEIEFLIGIFAHRNYLIKLGFETLMHLAHTLHKGDQTSEGTFIFVQSSIKSTKFLTVKFLTLCEKLIDSHEKTKMKIPSEIYQPLLSAQSGL